MAVQTLYKIRFQVAVYSNNKNIYRREVTVPTTYEKRSHCRAHIQNEIRSRLKHGFYFISPRIDYDLVRYAREASYNTYLRYRISAEKIEQVLPLSEGRGAQGAAGRGAIIDEPELGALTKASLDLRSGLNAKRMFELRNKIFPGSPSDIDRISN